MGARQARWLAPAVAVLAGAAGCGGDDTVKGPAPSAPSKMRISSAAFADGATIPRRFTCDGDDVSPPLRWSGVPREARELAVLVEDPDAPSGTFVHWTAFGLDPGSDGLPAATVAPKQGKNSFGDAKYGGPCPPEGDEPHRYIFAVYALSDRLVTGSGASPDGFRSAVSRVALARGKLTGTYGR
jgi:Raf kinase inhibitor-like YbhB/YbcL family protein